VECSDSYEPTFLRAKVFLEETILGTILTGKENLEQNSKSNPVPSTQSNLIAIHYPLTWKKDCSSLQ